MTHIRGTQVKRAHGGFVTKKAFSPPGRKKNFQNPRFFLVQVGAGVRVV
jgi:hypothetical protein